MCMIGVTNILEKYNIIHIIAITLIVIRVRLFDLNSMTFSIILILQIVWLLLALKHFVCSHIIPSGNITLKG